MNNKNNKTGINEKLENESRLIFTFQKIKTLLHSLFKNKIKQKNIKT
jgi:hypothetical protein